MVLIKTPVDIKTLVKNSSLETYDQIKLIERLKKHFDEEEQSLLKQHFTENKDYKITLIRSDERVHLLQKLLKYHHHV